MKNKFKIYVTLFTSTFYLSAFTLGGGYVIVPLMQKKFVYKLKLINEKEMLDLVCIAQSSPGAIAINTAILVGYKVAGIIGAMICTFATVRAPLIIISIICIFYDAFKTNEIISVFLKASRAAVCAVIVNVVINLSKDVLKENKLLSLVLMIVAFIAGFNFNVNVIFIILACALFGVTYTYWVCRKKNNLQGGSKNDIR